MPDSRFFEDLGSVGVGELMELTGASLAPRSAGAGAAFSMVAPLALAEADAVSFFSDQRHLDALKTTRAGAIFLAPAQAEFAPAGAAVLTTNEPKIAYAKAALRLHR